MTAKPYPVRSVERVEVIRTVSIWGDGTERAPYREVVQWWHEGKELAASDPLADVLGDDRT